MAKKNYVSLLRAKIFKKRMKVRVLYFKVCGLSVGRNITLGKIQCSWPNKVKIGNDCTIEDNVTFKTTKPFQEANRISIGNGVFIGNACQFNCNTQITIKDNCLIASNSIFVDTGHEIKAGCNINKQPLTLGSITLEEDVWIGTQCTVLKGVTIGKGSVVGAGSVVNKSIPPNQIWAGVPAKFIRNRD